MTNEVYRSWLTDRGLDSPGSQPFDLLGSKIYPASSCLILGCATSEVATQLLPSLAKLAEAISTPDNPTSWLLIGKAGSPPELRLVRSVLPVMTKVIYLTESQDSSVFDSSPVNIAGQEIRIFRGPMMELMNSNAELKRRFWNDVRAWLQK